MRFPIERLTRRIDEIGRHIVRERVPQPVWRTLPEAQATRMVPDPADPAWLPFQVGEWWGRDDATPWHWFRRQVTIPDAWDGRHVALCVHLGERHRPRYPEALAYVNGVARQGIDRNHDLVYLSDAARGGDTYEVALEAWRGMSDAEERFVQADLVLIDDEAWDFYHDANVAFGVARSLPEDDYARVHLINALEDAILEVDFREPLAGAFYDSLRRAREVLGERMAAVDLPPRHERVRAIGHAHIDVAWQWTLAQTRQKTARTFSTVLRLMERYPEYHFIGSQAQLYRFIEEDHPEILEEIRRRADEGRWEVNGATWVEMDTNVTSGESLVRQFLYGRRYFREVLGHEGDVLWLPDVFGYSGALPQIIRRAGITYFMTTKISWNQYNRFPYDTFYWVGIDGTPVLTHFVTTPSNNWFYTYNGALTPEVIQGTWEQNRSKDITDEILMTYGYGDGGGGPTAEMLETGRRLTRHPGAPQVVLGRANDFFHELDARIQGQRVPRWEGELYLEYHRGTLTSQAQVKRANRKSEILFHQAEAAAAAASLLGETYPAEALRQGWETILLNQFHDIIPGSSIRAVYEDADDDYARVAEIGGLVRQDALAAVAARIEGGAGVVVFNALGWPRTDLAE
ncbi:MAG: alpha-mannosidase, partial [Chloroflexi bacterium]|nr:alpha-mannosidase [Chloroflexota bacterium]